MTMLSNIPRYPLATARNRSSVGGFLVLLGRLADRLVAAAIVRHQRQAERAALHRFSDRELKDIGICRGGDRLRSGRGCEDTRAAQPLGR